MLIAVAVNMLRVQGHRAPEHDLGVVAHGRRAVIVVVLIIVPDNHKSFGYVFGQTINNSGFAGQNFGDIMFWYVFGIGLLMSQYTITGFDASAHMAEETRRRRGRRRSGMVHVGRRLGDLRLHPAASR